VLGAIGSDLKGQRVENTYGYDGQTSSQIKKAQRFDIDTIDANEPVRIIHSEYGLEE
jgi:hypothetical protein